MQEVPNARSDLSRSRSKTLALMSLFLALIIIGGFITIDIGPVPFSMQIVVVVLATTILKPRESFGVIFIYILMGLLGLPVFASKVASGVVYLLMPSFGFLIGFLVGGPVISLASNLRGDLASYMQLLIACLLGLLIIYSIGIAYMIILTKFYLGENTKIWTLLKYVILIFLPKDLFFCFLIPILAKRLKMHFAIQL